MAPFGENTVLFHHDNAPADTSAIATAKLFDLRKEILPHPPYSPNLAPSDYFLFPNMKTWLGGKRFSSNEEIFGAIIFKNCHEYLLFLYFFFKVENITIAMESAHFYSRHQMIKIHTVLLLRL